MGKRGPDCAIAFACSRGCPAPQGQGQGRAGGQIEEWPRREPVQRRANTTSGHPQATPALKKTSGGQIPRSPVPGPILGLLGTRTGGPPASRCHRHPLTPSPPAHGQPSVRFRQVPNTWDCIFRHVECFQKRATPLAHSTCPCSLEALSVWTVSLTGAHLPPSRKPSVSYPGAVIRPSRRERARTRRRACTPPPPYSTYGPVPHPPLPPPSGPWLARYPRGPAEIAAARFTGPRDSHARTPY